MCSQFPVNFPSVKNRKIQTEFSGGDITSDGGVMLLRSADEKLNLLRDVNKELPDARDPKLIKHSQLSLLRQRIFGICLGYDDLNDHNTLRNDPALQSAVNRVDPLASQSTLCRLENRTDRQAALKIHEIIIKKFITSFNQPPDKLILDFDATDDRVHGHQEGRAFHGYYDHHCFLPLYVFCGEKLLVSYLRPGNSDGFQHAWAILSLLVTDVTQKNFFMKFIYCIIHCMNKQLLDLYSDYLISSFNQTTATGLSKLLDGSVSHDKISRFLAERKYTSKDLWKEVKSTIRQIESDTAVLIVDDTIQEKPYSDENELICWHYDHSTGRTMKGINILNMLYSSDDAKIPVAFELIEKPFVFSDIATKKQKRKSNITVTPQVSCHGEIKNFTSA